MRTFSCKVEAVTFARFKAQLTGSCYRVIERGEVFAVGTEGKIMTSHPESVGWSFRFQH